MKIALLALSLFLFAFSSSGIVVDTDGNFVENRGSSYYIIPVLRGHGGGLRLGKTGNDTCAVSVIQSTSETSNGLPVIISSMYLTLHISEGFPLALWFVAKPVCGGGSSAADEAWTVADGFPFGWPVKLPGHSENEVKGLFNIQKHEDAYKLVYCVYFTNACADISVKTDENGVRQLVMADASTDGPFLVQFKKAHKSSSM